MEGFTRIQVPQNGRCFVACLHIFHELNATKRNLWASFLRSHTSMPVDGKTGVVDQKRLKLEEQGEGGGGYPKSLEVEKQ